MPFRRSRFSRNCQLRKLNNLSPPSTSPTTPTRLNQLNSDLQNLKEALHYKQPAKHSEYSFEIQNIQSDGVVGCLQDCAASVNSSTLGSECSNSSGFMLTRSRRRLQYQDNKEPLFSSNMSTQRIPVIKTTIEWPDTFVSPKINLTNLALSKFGQKCLKRLTDGDRELLSAQNSKKEDDHEELRNSVVTLEKSSSLCQTLSAVRMSIKTNNETDSNNDMSVLSKVDDDVTIKPTFIKPAILPKDISLLPLTSVENTPHKMTQSTPKFQPRVEKKAVVPVASLKSTSKAIQTRARLKRIIKCRIKKVLHGKKSMRFNSKKIKTRKGQRKLNVTTVEKISATPAVINLDDESEMNSSVFGHKMPETAHGYMPYGTISGDIPPPQPTTFVSTWGRMQHRAEQNPFAQGLVFLKSTSSPYALNDFFYREVLVRPKKKQINGETFGSNVGTSHSPACQFESDTCVDVITVDHPSFFGSNNLNGSVAPCDDDEVLYRNVADDCVAHVRQILTRERDDKQFQFTKEKYINVQEKVEVHDITIDDLCKSVKNSEQPYFYETLKIVISSIVNQRMTDLNTLYIANGCSLFYTLSVQNALRLDAKLRAGNVDRNLAIKTAHEFLLQRLPDEMLASYFNVLRYLQVTGSNLTSVILPETSGVVTEQVNKFIKKFVHTKILDPQRRFETRLPKLMPLAGVSLMLVYPQVEIGKMTTVKHEHENIFRLLPAAVHCVEKVELTFDSAKSVGDLFHKCVAKVRLRVLDFVRRRPNDYIFLAGWGVSALFNMQALLKVGGVSGVLNFAFPLNSCSGFRGTIDDSICLTYCPSLYVVGDCAINMNVEGICELRNNMISDTGLVVVGNANENLFVSPSILCLERLTQYCVDRIISEYVLEFIQKVIGEGGSQMTATEKRLFLRPLETPLSSTVK